MKRNVRVYCYRGRNYDVYYVSMYRKGSYSNYEDLMTEQRKSYGRFLTIEDFYDYKKELDRIDIYR